jgi:uncharacterized protein (TIGR01777 family)
MKILISGSTGLVGRHLKRSLESLGHSVYALVRDKTKKGEGDVYWDPLHGVIDKQALEGFDAVVHLAGENIASGRWSEAKKKKILDSRVKGTKLLAEALASLKTPPKVFVSGSAIGYYGNRGDETCLELTSSGDGFLADVCRQWEEAASPASEAGIRTVLLRTGVVLAPDGGALSKMLTPFKMGLGGVLGSGEQYISWIAIDDLTAVISFIISDRFMNGPINAVAPFPVTNREFTKALGAALHRPTVLPVPAAALKMILGKEMAEEFLLGSTRVLPDVLLGEGYRFEYPNVEGALQHILQA